MNTKINYGEMEKWGNKEMEKNKLPFSPVLHPHQFSFLSQLIMNGVLYVL